MSNLDQFEKHTGLFRIILTLENNNELSMSELSFTAGVHWKAMYRSLAKLKDLGLIVSRIDNSSYPPKNMISLTEKGKNIAKKLNEIEEILNKDKRGV